MIDFYKIHGRLIRRRPHCYPYVYADSNTRPKDLFVFVLFGFGFIFRIPSGRLVRRLVSLLSSDLSLMTLPDLNALLAGAAFSPAVSGRPSDPAVVAAPLAAVPSPSGPVPPPVGAPVVAPPFLSVPAPPQGAQVMFMMPGGGCF